MTIILQILIGIIAIAVGLFAIGLILYLIGHIWSCFDRENEYYTDEKMGIGMVVIVMTLLVYVIIYVSADAGKEINKLWM